MTGVQTCALPICFPVTISGCFPVTIIKTGYTKTRGEVAGSRKKIGPQKGSGGARHGNITAPIFVGGGIAHGPKAKGKHRVDVITKFIVLILTVFTNLILSVFVGVFFYFILKFLLKYRKIA